MKAKYGSNCVRRAPTVYVWAGTGPLALTVYFWAGTGPLAPTVYIWAGTGPLALTVHIWAGAGPLAPLAEAEGYSRRFFFFRKMGVFFGGKCVLCDFSKK